MYPGVARESAVEPASVQNARGALLAGSLIILFVVFLYAPIVSDLMNDWLHDEDSSYGLLVPPLALYVAWLYRRKIARAPVAQDGAGLALVALACLMYVAGKAAAEFYLARTSLIVLGAGLLWTFAGRAVLRTLLFPLLLLLTSVPLPRLVYNAAALPLQLFASSSAVDIIQFFGGTVYRDGNIIQLPDISLGVAEACSGLRSLTTLVVAALLVGFLACRRPLTRVILLILAIPLAVGVNVLRIAGTAWIATYKQDLALGFYHSFSGWLVFVASFGILVLLAKGLHSLLEAESR